MAKLFLPKLTKLKQNIDISEHGKWHGMSAEILRTLSNSLDLGKDNRDVITNCIPEVWARPLLFEMALYDENHFLHNVIRGEWRGLLTIFAFELFNHDLECVKVNIQKPNSENPRESLRFIDLISDDTLWHDLYIIKYKNKPIGITSPTTLVCTAIDYADYEEKDNDEKVEKVILEGIRWFNGKIFTDPISLLNETEKNALACWLEYIKNNISEINQYYHLIDQINLFQKDLGKAKGGFNLSDKASLRIESGIFKHLNRPIGFEKPSDVELRSSEGKNPSLRLLVVDKDIPTQWKMQAHEIHVESGATIAEIPRNPSNDRKKFGSINLPIKTEIRFRKDFFTDKLYVIQQKDAFPGALIPDTAEKLLMDEVEVTPILPIKDEILNYLSSEELYRRIEFESNKEEIIVHLTLTLSGLNGNVKDVVISKNYGKDQIEIIFDTPVLEIYPNFVIVDTPDDNTERKWNAYYTYCSSNNADTFYAMPYVSSGKPELRPHKRNESNMITHWIVRTDVFPEAMICGRYAETSDNKELKVKVSDLFGILLLKETDKTRRRQLRWVIGIDFGTTNTNIYIRKGSDGEPSVMEFKKKYLFQVTASGARRSLLYDEFLPGEDLKTPFLSFYQCFSRINQNIKVLLDGHIFFLDSEKQFKADDYNIKTDLKWSQNSNDRLCLNVFLKQLCLQCLAEAASSGVEEIEWRFSFPTSFSSDDLQAFKSCWNMIAASLSEITGITQTVAEAIPEGVAAAQYFVVHKNIRASIATEMICMDVGGGSTDISIWHEAKLLHQTSLRFAGRHLFLEPIRENPDFLKIFGVNVDNLKRIKNTEIAFYAQAEAIIKTNGQDWLKKIQNNKDISQHPVMKGFIQLLAIGLAGIYYYIGLILNQYSDKISTMPNIYIAGNGGHIFDWVANGEYGKNSPINTLFKSALIATSKIRTSIESFDVMLSPNPKAEVAYALASEAVPLIYNKDQFNQSKVLAGETFTKNNIKCKWNKEISSGDLFSGIKLSNEMEHLRQFIEVFNGYAKPRNIIEILIGQESKLLSDIFTKMHDKLTFFSIAKTAENIRVEPLFIMELKDLLDKEIREWARSQD